jgi:hypothetical protein
MNQEILDWPKRLARELTKHVSGLTKRFLTDPNDWHLRNLVNLKLLGQPSFFLIHGSRPLVNSQVTSLKLANSPVWLLWSALFFVDQRRFSNWWRIWHAAKL